jgi:phosphoribosylamine--glycine ligase
MTNVLVLGSGGREHTLSWKIAQSPLLGQLYIAPGNAGTQQVGTNVPIQPTDFEAIKIFCIQNSIHLVVVGPEDPLVLGITDYFASQPDLQKILVVGPSAAAAKLEGSKAHAKAFMKKYNIPTAAYEAFTLDTLEAGWAFLEKLAPPYVLKADGLAAGKGVVILNDLEAAKQELQDMLSGKFGAASAQVVIEEFLAGIEFSVFALTDGKDYLLLPEAKDYKRIGEGDTGLNTGGMGAVSPVPFFDAALQSKTIQQIVEPTIKGIAAEGHPYVGFVFFGLINVAGEPKVIEYNVRMGDPETEVVIPRIEGDLLPLLLSAAQGNLREQTITITPETATTVMVVSAGYPGDYQKGHTITGLEKVAQDVKVFHAGTKMQADQVVTNGGRVLAFTALGNNLDGALTKSYAAINQICFEGIAYRKDIGQDLK